MSRWLRAKIGLNGPNDKYGMKILKSGPQHKYDTRPGVLKVWRENAVFEKQHFTMANKLKLVKYMQNTFAANENKNGNNN